jgi:hypothetical protein
MGEVIPLEDPLNYRRVMRRIKGLLEEGTLIIGAHAREEMAKDDLDDTDVLNVIRTGTIRPNSHSRPKGRWRYVVEGTTVDAGRAACVVEVNGGLIVVTVFALK